MGLTTIVKATCDGCGEEVNVKLGKAAVRKRNRNPNNSLLLGCFLVVDECDQDPDCAAFSVQESPDKDDVDDGEGLACSWKCVHTVLDNLYQKYQRSKAE